MCFCDPKPYPTALGIKISKLKPGDEVIVLQGEGCPPVAKETLTIIAAVKNYSALTVEGTVLCGQSVSDLIVTGKNITTYELSPEAQAILAEIKACEAEEAGFWAEEDDTTGEVIDLGAPFDFDLGDDPLELL